MSRPDVVVVGAGTGRPVRRARPRGGRSAGDGAGGPRPRRRAGRTGRAPRRPARPARRRGGGQRAHQLSRTGRGARSHRDGVVRRGAGRAHPPAPRHACRSASGRPGTPTPTAPRTRRSRGCSRSWSPRSTRLTPSPTQTCTGSTGMSVGDFLREAGATAAVLRAMDLVHLSLADGSIERQSMFAYARKQAVGGGTAAYDVTEWENQRVAEGSATVALTMAAGLRDVRLSTPVRRIEVGPSSVVTTHEGEELRADAVVIAVPSGPARDLDITGVSEARLTSLRRQRHAWAAKFVAAYDEPFWRERGQNALAESEGVLGSTWPQQHGVLSALVPPERYAAFAATDPGTRTREALAQIAELYGPEAPSPLQTWTRLWGTDPWTQGYVTNWRPGDVEAVGPLHGTHEPPFYVCGSDQWVAGYMEGAVRTGRGRRGSGPAHGQARQRGTDGLRSDRRAAQHRGGDPRVRRARALPPRGGGRAHGCAAARARRPDPRQGPGRGSLRRQHARGGRRGRPRHGDVGALREGARQGQLRAALHRRRPTLQHPAGRHRGAARALPLPVRARREDRLPGDDRAGRRVRHAGHAHQGHPRR